MPEIFPRRADNIEGIFEFRPKDDNPFLVDAWLPAEGYPLRFYVNVGGKGTILHQAEMAEMFSALGKWLSVNGA